jgi:hypothetical protein
MFTLLNFRGFDRSKSQNFVDTQSFSTQNLKQTETQKVDSQEMLEEAFEYDFNVDDAPVYSTKKSPFLDFLEYCTLCSNQKELEDAEVGEGGVSHIDNYLYFVNTLVLIESNNRNNACIQR